MGPPQYQPLHLTRRHYGFSGFNVSPAAAQVNAVVRRLGETGFTAPQSFEDTSYEGRSVSSGSRASDYPL
jgi:hypothetical protein